MEILETLLDAFEEQYYAADSIQESDEQFTSQEIINLFDTATEVDKVKLFEELQARGFKTKLLDKSFVWPVKEKELH